MSKLKINLRKPKFLTRGNVAMFVLSLMAGVFFGAVTSAFTPDRLNVFVATVIGGMAALFAVAKLYDEVSQPIPFGPEPAILGTTASVIIMLATI